jgi:hypothetical protein
MDVTANRTLRLVADVEAFIAAKNIEACRFQAIIGSEKASDEDRFSGICGVRPP